MFKLIWRSAAIRQAPVRQTAIACYGHPLNWQAVVRVSVCSMRGSV